MSKMCDVCGKSTVFGRAVSHAHNVTSRRFHPNLQTVRVQHTGGGTSRVKLCTRCLRSGAVKKAVR